MTAPYLNDSDHNKAFANAQAETTMTAITQIIGGIRNVRGEMNIAPSMKLDVIVQSADEALRRTISEHQDLVINLARLKGITVEMPGVRPKSAATAVVENASIYVSLEGIIDFTKEIERLEKEISKLGNELKKVVKKLVNEDFLSKAPHNVVNKVKTKHSELVEKQQKLQTNLDTIKSVAAE
jgi:valyl-tRNA synthetase